MNTKSFVKSKTFWANVLFFLSTLVPGVQGWVESNPVSFGALWAAMGVLIRFATHGKISLAVPEDGSAGGGVNLILMVGLMGMALGFGGFLTSCSPSYYDADLRGYEEAIAREPERVRIDAKDVTPGGQTFAPEISGTFRTDQGDFVVGPDGVSGNVVVDVRSGK